MLDNRLRKDQCPGQVDGTDLEIMAELFHKQVTIAIPPILRVAVCGLSCILTRIQGVCLN